MVVMVTEETCLSRSETRFDSHDYGKKDSYMITVGNITCRKYAELSINFQINILALFTYQPPNQHTCSVYLNILMQILKGTSIR